MADSRQLEWLEHFKLTRESPATETRRPLQIWERQHELGAGSFGVVYLETETRSGKARAVKEITKRRNHDYRAELIALTRLSRPAYADHFGQFLGWYDEPSSVGIVMEYFQHGDLRKHMSGPMPEHDAREITFQVLFGLQVMHQDGFTHRDLKPENIFVAQPAPVWQVKLGDFGISKRVNDESTALRTRTGTKHYVAPEVEGALPGSLQATGYTNSVDMWALGVILYEMLCACTPFSTTFELTEYCRNASGFPEGPLNLQGVSDSGNLLLRRFLTPAPHLRPSAVTALQTRWLHDNVGTLDAKFSTLHLSKPSLSTPPEVTQETEQVDEISSEDDTAQAFPEAPEDYHDPIHSSPDAIVEVAGNEEFSPPRNDKGQNSFLSNTYSPASTSVTPDPGASNKNPRGLPKKHEIQTQSKNYRVQIVTTWMCIPESIGSCYPCRNHQRYNSYEQAAFHIHRDHSDEKPAFSRLNLEKFRPWVKEVKQAVTQKPDGQTVKVEDVSDSDSDDQPEQHAGIALSDIESLQDVVRTPPPKILACESSKVEQRRVMARKTITSRDPRRVYYRLKVPASAEPIGDKYEETTTTDAVACKVGNGVLMLGARSRETIRGPISDRRMWKLHVRDDHITCSTIQSKRTENYLREDRIVSCAWSDLYLAVIHQSTRKGESNTKNLSFFDLDEFDNSNSNKNSSNSLRKKALYPVTWLDSDYADMPEFHPGIKMCFVNSALLLFDPFSGVYSLRVSPATTNSRLQVWGERLARARSNPRPPLRTETVCVGYKKWFVIFGGQSYGKWDTESRQTRLNDMWAFDTESRIWEQWIPGGETPLPQAGHCAVVVDDAMYVYADTKPRLFLKEEQVFGLLKYDIVDSVWYQLQDERLSPPTLKDCCMVAVDDRLIILGGSEPDFSAISSRDHAHVWVLDLNQNIEWDKLCIDRDSLWP